jgi:glucose/arabinose dehydrogenase
MTLSSRLSFRLLLRRAGIAAALGVLFLSGCMEANDPAKDRDAKEKELATGLSTVISGFTDVMVAGGLTNPTQMEFAPDGRIFVSEQSGKLRVIKGTSLLSTPFLSLSVSTTGERGLLGIAFDPNWANEKWVYVYYTVPSSPPHNRVSRFMTSSTNPDVAQAGSEQVLINLPDSLCDCGFHNGGAVHFGKDGKLYISVGESTVGVRAQRLSITMGKVLRIEKDGKIPTDNPFLSQTTGSNQAIYALGFRNPYTFAVQPGTGRIFVDDVGNQTWEEIDDLVAGKNYGWPTTEGATTDSRFVSPFYTYNHSGGECAISGGAFYNPTTVRFPSDYVGDYFFCDYCGNWIKRIDLATKHVDNLVSAISKPTDVKVGNDGNLYYVARSAGQVRKVSSTTSQAPAISDQPVSTTVAVGEPASFTVAASGPAPLGYQWQRNGTNITGATAATFTLSSTTLADNGAGFRCVVSNAGGAVTSNTATLTVLDDHRPVAQITSPALGTTYVGGQTITYSGTGTDQEDGNLPAANLTWEIRFFHNDGSPHFHPYFGPASGSTGGSFTVSTSNETSQNVWYALYLTVKDAQGLTSRDTLEIHPVTSVITLATNPSGLTVNLDGAAKVTPFTFTGVVGILRNLSAPSPQTLGGKGYAFASWSDGGAATHDISTPSAATTFTATFNEQPIVTYEAEAAAFSGPVVTTKHAGYTGTGYLDFTNATGDWVEFTVNVTAAGSVPLQFRYANAGGAGDKLKITEGSTTLNAGLGFPSTGSWDVWATTTAFNATLTAGTHKIRATSIGAGVPNVDNMTVTNGSSAPTAPSITQQPANQTVTAGQTATFTVGASGTAPLAYQWQRESVDISGANSASYSLTAQAGDDGAHFRCVVSNAQGTAASNAALLTVSTAPSPTQILEAETALFSGPVVTTKHPGYTGTGYLDFTNNSGDFVEWTVNMASAGTVPMAIRYANGSGATIKVSVTVNGVVVNSGLSMPVTGTTWEVWSTAGFSAALNAGSNKVRITTINVGQPNVDNLKIN